MLFPKFDFLKCDLTIYWEGPTYFSKEAIFILKIKVSE